VSSQPAKIDSDNIKPYEKTGCEPHGVGT
jgi:hypothetical protein